MGKYKLSPSILAADFGNLAAQIKEAEREGAPYIHMDVMDGVFVPNISFGVPVISSLRSVSECFYDVHLMITQPEKYIKKFCQIGADGVTFHLEATKDVDKCFELIESCGKKKGISISPDTPVSALSDEMLERADMILIMTVHPGFGGQTYIESSTDKIKELKRRLKDLKLDRDIEVDGGITRENVEVVLNAGANVIVMGSSVFKGDIGDNVRFFNKLFKKYEK
ncbi:MAG: ribulose-phosphate 3-epimerase [Lachnospiraceae bacterium]|nr:ribulose-phosphate 3-epimerase [Lachnospiraceae bacterium]